MYFVYILQSEMDSSYYKGHTNDLADRIKRHNSGSEEFTRKGIPWKLVWVGCKPSKSEAYRLERKLKNLSRVRLESFILKHIDLELLERFRP